MVLPRDFPLESLTVHNVEAQHEHGGSDFTGLEAEHKFVLVEYEL